jgi:hypothetical protein
MAKVEKLTIESYKFIDCKEPDKLKGIYLQVNPEKISFDFGIKYGEEGGGTDRNGEAGSSGAAGESCPVLGSPTYDFPDFQVTTLIDATGVLPAPEKHPDGDEISLLDGEMPTVTKYIEALKKVCYNYQDETHGPPYVKIYWGKVMPSSGNAENEVDGVFRGRLTKLAIEYTLFGSAGNPVRAEINMTFGAAMDPEARPTGNSPDLTHFIQVKYGDNLPKLCKDVYGSPEFFLQIAKVNNLPSIYAIEPGMTLLFPPLDKASR